jgi:hypothetical protein
MRDLFERLRHQGHSVIEELVKTRAQETVQLDFKLKDNQTNGELTKKDRETLGPALSALANSAGGLLIWGIQAKRDADGVDAAQTKVPIPQLARFRSDVVRAVGELLMPRHDGIEVEAIDDPATAGAGYLAIWVDRSDRRPHRSEAAGDKRYYRRAGDSSFVMEHYDIEDAFNRTAPTELKLAVAEIRNTPGGPSGDGMTRTNHYLAFFFNNEDRSSASAPYCWVDKITAGRPLAKVDGMQPSVLDPYLNGTKLVFGSSSQVLVHPGMALLAFYFNIVVITRRDGKTTINGDRPHEVTVAFSYGFGCQNARMTTGRFELKGTLLSDLVDGALPHDELVRRIDQQCMHKSA